MGFPKNERAFKDEIRQEFIAVCSDDERGEDLWRLLKIIRYIGAGKIDERMEDRSMAHGDVRRLAIEVLRELIEEGQLDVWFTNYPVTSRYSLEKSNESVEAVMSRIEAEWDALSREPGMCEVAVFHARRR